MESSGGADRDDDTAEFCEREDLCIAKPARTTPLHTGDVGYRDELVRRYRSAENNAMGRLTKLRMDLRAAATVEEFWPMATHGLATLTGAQYAFISKRMLVDNEDATVEMPPFGTKGSCLMSQAFYYDDGLGRSGNPLNIKYQVYGGPCEFMKYDKTLLIPEKLTEVFPSNPNGPLLVVPAEAYLGVPLRDREGKCFALFGVMWSKEGLEKLQLGWAFLEMMFHALEDVILTGFLERGKFASALKNNPNPKAVIPHQAVTAAQSLKPYARNLSHELRTPMQGVVGMLDVMYATVQEAAEGQKDLSVLAVLDNLRENIEVVQDSSRRAVEAADNVVHAYDMNMGIPETPTTPPHDSSLVAQVRSKKEKRPDIIVTGENVPINFECNKRKRENQNEPREPVHKLRRTEPSSGSSRLNRELFPDDQTLPLTKELQELPYGVKSPTIAYLESCDQVSIPPGLRHTNLRDLLQFLINDLLKVGGRPDFAIAMESEGGEDIEVRVRSPNGDEKTKHIHWSVDSSVPDTILIEEQSLVKVISSVYSNAIKFTEEGSVEVRAQLSPRSRYIIIRVRDTGVGIREEFVPQLFQPFSKEDNSLTRQSEGLGLGLMVAKGLARKLGGDLALVQTSTNGTEHGSEFEIRVPMTPADITSSPSTPSGSPAPSHRSHHSVYDDEVGSHRRTRSGSFRPFKAPPARTSPRYSPPNTQIQTSSPPQTVHARAAATALERFSKTPRKSSPKRVEQFDRNLAQRFPLRLLVVEDNKINRKLLVSMLGKLGYKDVHEAYDGSHAVRQMETLGGKVDLILMDLWMPYMDGYEASERILAMSWDEHGAASGAIPVNGQSKFKAPTILAVTADVTDGALEKAATVGMKGFLTKPFKVVDLERLILEYCATRRVDGEVRAL